ncbi:MAG: hypothetical protein ACI83P_002187 [Janthinobacterium sp.]|jgi:hypothetical protein
MPALPGIFWRFSCLHFHLATMRRCAAHEAVRPVEV